MPGQTTRVEPAEQKPGLDQVLRDTWYVFWREMLLPLRDPFSLVFSLLQPLVFLGLFGPCSVRQWALRPSAASPRCSGSCPAWSS
jgi:hypothetical protein